jgi:hypothetical protein
LDEASSIPGVFNNLDSEDVADCYITSSVNDGATMESTYWMSRRFWWLTRPVSPGFYLAKA